MHNLNVENYILFRTLLRTIAQEGSLSYSSEGLFQRGKGGARLYKSICCKKKKTKKKTKQKNTCSQTSKDYSWEFPGGSVVRNQCFHCRGPGFKP